MERSTPGRRSHDFNNLLTAITGYAEVALEANRPAEDARADIEEILKASHMASALTRQLLAFSRRRVLHVAAIDVNAIVGRMDGLLRRLIGEDVELRADLCQASECVRADAGQIEQVIMNLALNARDAMPAGGCLTVETRVVTLTTSSWPGTTARPSGVTSG
jgi:signal transduction histidine kinase